MKQNKTPFDFLSIPSIEPIDQVGWRVPTGTCSFLCDQHCTQEEEKSSEMINKINKKLERQENEISDMKKHFQIGLEKQRIETKNLKKMMKDGLKNQQDQIDYWTKKKKLSPETPPNFVLPNLPTNYNREQVIKGGYNFHNIQGSGQFNQGGGVYNQQQNILPPLILPPGPGGSQFRRRSSCPTVGSIGEKRPVPNFNGVHNNQITPPKKRFRKKGAKFFEKEDKQTKCCIRYCNNLVVNTDFRFPNYDSVDVKDGFLALSWGKVCEFHFGEMIV